MNKITWTNGVTKLNKATMDTFQNNIENAIDGQIETFDVTLKSGVSKVTTGINKGYYNKSTKQVTILLNLNVGKTFDGSHISVAQVPSKYAPSAEVYTTGTALGGSLLQVTITSNGNVDFWAAATPSSQGRGTIIYFLN